MTATRLSDKAVVRLVKDTAEAVGDGDPGLMERTFGSLAVGATRSYSGHSLRAGLATAAAEAEAQLHDVMRQTRHKSVEVARRYMRSADLWRNNVTEKVMRLEPEDGGSGAAAKAKLRSQRNETHLQAAASAEVASARRLIDRTGLTVPMCYTDAGEPHGRALILFAIIQGLPSWTLSTI